MNDIFRQIAKENGTTEKAVKEEMQFAIREAMKSAEPEALFIASRMANCISSFTAFSVVPFFFAICLNMSFTSTSSYVY